MFSRLKVPALVLVVLVGLVGFSAIRYSWIRKLQNQNSALEEQSSMWENYAEYYQEKADYWKTNDAAHNSQLYWVTSGRAAVSLASPFVENWVEYNDWVSDREHEVSREFGWGFEAEYTALSQIGWFDWFYSMIAHDYVFQDGTHYVTYDALDYYLRFPDGVQWVLDRQSFIENGDVDEYWGLKDDRHYAYAGKVEVGIYQVTPNEIENYYPLDSLDNVLDENTRYSFGKSGPQVTGANVTAENGDVIQTYSIGYYEGAVRSHGILGVIRAEYFDYGQEQPLTEEIIQSLFFNLTEQVQAIALTLENIGGGS